VGIVDQTVEDGIRQGWVTNGFMPMIDGKLARDDGGTSPVAIFEDLQQIPAL